MSLSNIQFGCLTLDISLMESWINGEHCKVTPTPNKHALETNNGKGKGKYGYTECEGMNYEGTWVETVYETGLTI
jgi:hypothetical protein